MSFEKYIDKFKRIQTKLKIHHIFPKRKDKICRCGCGKKVKHPQRYWHSKNCVDKAYTVYAIRKGISNVIRLEILKRDKGICARCNNKHINKYGDWEAHHIIPVMNGGGGCDLSNYETLCLKCHKQETKGLRKRKPKRIKLKRRIA